MNIWLMNRFYYPSIGGLETSLYCISKELQQMGHTVHIFTEKLQKEGKKRKEFAKIHYYTDSQSCIYKIVFPLRTYGRFNQIKKNMRRWMRYENVPDLIISRDPVMTYVAEKLFKEVRIVYIPPVVIAFNKTKGNMDFLHNVVINTSLCAEQIFQEKCFDRIKELVVFSENIKKQIICRMKKDNLPIRVIYPGCDKKFFFCGNEYRYNAEKIKFLFVGRLVADKNLAMLLEAYARLQKLTSSKMSLTIVGDGMQRQQLERMVSDLEIPNVEFEGFKNNTEEYYSKADFFVIPSKYEAFGQVILEAFASGTPVIGFSTIQGKTLTAIDELVTDKETGFVVKELSARGLCEKMCEAVKVHQIKDDYLRMRKKCIEQASKSYTWETFIRKLLMEEEDENSTAKAKI